MKTIFQGLGLVIFIGGVLGIMIYFIYNLISSLNLYCLNNGNFPAF